MLQLKILTHSELTRCSDQWDDLWLRSEASLPTQRCAGIQLWCETFAPNAELETIVVESDGQWIAGLPLLKEKLCWPLMSYRIPSNHTVRSGDLLIDPACNCMAATNAIAGQIAVLPGTFAKFEGIQIDSERWQRLIASLQCEGRAMHPSSGHEVGVVDILHDWNAYKSSWSANHRSSVKRSQKKLEAEGEVSIERLQNPSDAELFEVLETCFAIEDKSWKGENGTSILATPGLRDYYHQEARIMRDMAALDLWLLRLDCQIIAFEYCHFSKGTCLSHKISFDPDFERLSPGKVLRAMQLEQLHQDPAAKQLDTLGVLCEAKAKWITQRYRSSRLFVAVGGHTSNLALRALTSLKGVANRSKPVESRTFDSNPPGERPVDTPQNAVASSATKQHPPIVCPDAIPGNEQSCS